MALKLALSHKLHPRIEAFHMMRLVTRNLMEDGDGLLWIVPGLDAHAGQRRDDATGERQRLTYRLDTLPEPL